MGILDTITSILQRPQSALMGISHAMGQNFATSEGRKLMGEALSKGFSGGWRPSDELDGRDTLSNGVVGNVADLLFDPTIVAGPASKALGLASKAPKVASIIDQANTIGKIGEGATAAGKLGQFARRGYQGTMMMGDPLQGLAAGSVLGVGEHAISPVLSKISARAARQALAANENAITGLAEDAPGFIGPRQEVGPRLDEIGSSESLPGFIGPRMQFGPDLSETYPAGDIAGMAEGIRNADPTFDLRQHLASLNRKNQLPGDLSEISPQEISPRATIPDPQLELNSGPPVRAHGESPRALNSAPVPRPHEPAPRALPEQLALNPAPTPIPHTGSLAVEPVQNPMSELEAILKQRVPNQTMGYEAPPQALPMGPRPMGSGEFGPATEGASSVNRFQELLGETSPESLEAMLGRMKSGRKPSGAFLDKVTTGQSAQLNELMADPQTRELVLAMLARSGT